MKRIQSKRFRQAVQAASDNFKAGHATHAVLNLIRVETVLGSPIAICRMMGAKVDPEGQLIDTGQRTLIKPPLEWLEDATQLYAELK